MAPSHLTHSFSSERPTVMLRLDEDIFSPRSFLFPTSILAVKGIGRGGTPKAANASNPSNESRAKSSLRRKLTGTPGYTRGPGVSR